MVGRIAACLLVACLAGASACQKDTRASTTHPPCNDSSLSVSIGFALADSFVLLTDPQGHRFGLDSSGNAVPREIPQAFYEDENTTEMDTNLLPERKPREIVVPGAKPGKYVVTVTSRKAGDPWLKITTIVCGKIWREEFSIPSTRPATLVPLALTWDLHADGEPQLLMDARPLEPIRKSVVARPHSANK